MVTWRDIFIGTLILGTHKDIIGPGGQHLFLDVDDWVIDYRGC